jgi:hypothetical protein
MTEEKWGKKKYEKVLIQLWNTDKQKKFWEVIPGVA